jgi:hypothetical protein
MLKIDILNSNSMFPEKPVTLSWTEWYTLKLKSQNLKTVPQPVCVWNGEEIQPVI